MEENNFCVYVHTNKVNGKKYVGQSCNPEKRWGPDGVGYCRLNKRGEYTQPLFANAILKYGWDNFEHEIVYSNLSSQEANELEIQLIEQYNTLDRDFGYNIRPGGSNSPMSEESKKKLSESLTGLFAGEKNPMYGKSGELSPNWGRKHSEEQNRQDSERKKGENNPMYGYIWSEEQIEKKRQWALEHPITPEQRQKMTEGAREWHKTHESPMKGIPRSEETKRKLSEALTGRKMSPEAIQHMKESHPDMSGDKNPRARAVICVETGEVFGAASEAGKRYNLSPSNPGTDIRKCCEGKRKSAGQDENGNRLHWKWFVENDNIDFDKVD